MTIIWWLRRDIRLDDNVALSEAHKQSDGSVVPVFVLDPNLLNGSYAGPARVHFLMESLRVLDDRLRERGARLTVREGDPVGELAKLAREVEAEAIFFNRDYEPYARKRDQQVEHKLSQAGLRVHSFKDRLLIEPGELLSTGGKPFTVYTPYRRRWLQMLIDTSALSAKHTGADQMQFKPIADAVQSLPIPAAAERGYPTDQQIIAPGEAAAQRQLASFARRGSTGLREYHHNRNKLGIDGTSRLAPHLRHGTLSPRAAARAALGLRQRTDDADERKACEAWLGELAWRDFYTAIMWHFPYVLERPYRDLFVNFPYRDAPDELRAWQQGRTGYPVVDAAMRQLNTEGFMHNRGRLITASFLVKDLLIDYRAGADYFWQQLACGDHAVNTGNWQWVAGSSNDPQPYFRIFNPVTQGETYDPDGSYVRRYVPELAHVPDRYIHTPWLMPQPDADAIGFRLDRDYPAPMVDHKLARERARAAFKHLRDEFYGGEAGEESDPRMDANARE